ncbi:hypothetical protein AGDE_15073 [Angomonas deanei]|uniref:Uncharacterized protein n=1 Tax=Angomonas deanei TaxID=59799 RepID=A0A7G2CRI0_9TRYP|nr:hypothetical protein AGDE_15073 [Angomonas deanei]CAD2221123.1 hypothetical protein, conserved [Angomonas deanei]|eukprot:EPY19728.1 hypothetical protein AGDE_15073 [Angomonas deanei]
MARWFSSRICITSCIHPSVSLVFCGSARRAPRLDAVRFCGDAGVARVPGGTIGGRCAVRTGGATFSFRAVGTAETSLHTVLISTTSTSLSQCRGASSTFAPPPPRQQSCVVKWFALFASRFAVGTNSGTVRVVERPGRTVESDAIVLISSAASSSSASHRLAAVTSSPASGCVFAKSISGVKPEDAGGVIAASLLFSTFGGGEVTFPLTLLVRFKLFFFCRKRALLLSAGPLLSDLLNAVPSGAFFASHDGVLALFNRWKTFCFPVFAFRLAATAF